MPQRANAHACLMQSMMVAPSGTPRHVWRHLTLNKRWCQLLPNKTAMLCKVECSNIHGQNGQLPRIGLSHHLALSALASRFSRVCRE